MRSGVLASFESCSLISSSYHDRIPPLQNSRLSEDRTEYIPSPLDRPTLLPNPSIAPPSLMPPRRMVWRECERAANTMSTWSRRDSLKYDIGGGVGRSSTSELSRAVIHSLLQSGQVTPRDVERVVLAFNTDQIVMDSITDPVQLFACAHHGQPKSWEILFRGSFIHAESCFSTSETTPRR